MTPPRTPGRRPASRTKPGYRRVGFNLPDELVERLDAEADRRLVNTTLVVERAITEWLDAHQREDPTA